MPNYQGFGQESGIGSAEVIYPEDIFPDTTIEYIEGGNFNYLNKNGQTVGGGRKQDDGSYRIYYKGKIKQKGYLFGSVPEKVKRDSAGVSEAVKRGVFDDTENNSRRTIIVEKKTYYPSPAGATVVRTRNGEVIRNNIDKTTYDRNGRPYYRWNSLEMSTSHIKDPKIRAEVRYQQVKEDVRRREADRKR